ncbi:MAG: polysaccharide deacetylase family protein, partial [Streptosporangiaceae bacterium]|nr:polysaccharide deacetylase family protein [Streptosporangiaceae bacterium]
MTEREMRMQADRDPRRAGRPGDGERLRVSRRRVLVAGGAVLLTTTIAAIASEHGGQQRPPNAAGGRGAPPAARDSHPAPEPGHQRLAHRAARPAQHEQPRLPYGHPMYDVNDGPKTVALTIDDGPSPVYTPQVLQVLHRYGVTASFSMVGRNAAAYPGVAGEVAAAGHMIVNHTWNHYDLARMTAVGVQDEIARAADAIHAATGQLPNMFRAPYGFWSPAVF